MLPGATPHQQGGNRGRSSISGRRPTKTDLRRGGGTFRRTGRPTSQQRVLGDYEASTARAMSRERVIDDFEASVAKTIAEKGSRVRGRGVPDMDSWAAALGVDIEASKVMERDRRRVEMDETGRSRQPGGWAPPPPAPVRVASTSSLERYRGRDAPTQQQPRRSYRDAGAQQQQQRQSYASSSRRKQYLPPDREIRANQVPEVVALDGFLSDLQGRLASLEGEAEATGAVARGSAAEILPAYDARATERTLGFGGGVLSDTQRTPGFDGSVLSHRRTVLSDTMVDTYGVPRSLVASAEQVREGATRTSEGL